MATELYNVLKTVIDPRYMSIFKFKKGQKIQFPCYCVKSIFWTNSPDTSMQIIINGHPRNEYRDPTYYNFLLPWQGMTMQLASACIYRYNTCNSNKISMYTMGASSSHYDITAQKSYYICEFNMKNNDNSNDIIVIAEHAYNFTTSVKKIFI